MKKVGIGLWVAVCGLFLMVGVAWAADKFAYVDVTRIASEYTKAKDYAKKIEAKATGVDADVEKKVKEIKDLQDKVNLLSDKEKEAKKTEIEKKIKDLQDYRRQKETDLRKEDFDNTKEIVDDIKGTIKDYADKQGYTLVFDDRALVFENKSMDITDKIIEDLNKKTTATTGAKK